MLRERRVLLITVIISLFLLSGVIYPISSNGGKQGKTIEDRIQEYYSEPIDFSERPGSEPPKDTVPEGSLEAKLEIDHPPKIGETAHLTFTITSHWDFSKVRVEIGMWRERNVDREAGIKVVSGLEEFQMSKERRGSRYIYTFFCPLKSDESRKYEFDIEVTSIGIKYISGGVGMSPQKNWKRPICAGDGFYLDVGDTVTRISKKPFPPPPEYWRTPLSNSGGPWFGPENMKKDMGKFIKVCPELTSWDARWLVDKAEMHSIFPYEIDKVLTKKRKEIEKEAIKKKIESIDLLEERRILIREMIKQAYKKAKREKKTLYKVFKEVIEEWKKLRPEEKFIGPENKGNSRFDKPRADSVTVKGYFKFKKHLYSKETGLDSITIDKPMRRVMVWVWENVPTPTYIGRCVTDNNGYFEKKVQVAGSGYIHHVYEKWGQRPFFDRHESFIIGIVYNATDCKSCSS